MRYPNHFHENIDHPENHEGEQSEQGRHPRGHGRFHRGGKGFGPGRSGEGFGPGFHREAGFGHDHAGRSPRCEQHQAHGRGRGHGQPGEQPHGGAHRRPTLERGILKSARRIRRSGLSPEQLHRRIAATVSHADYVTTMRTLRRIGMELRTERGTTEHSTTEHSTTEHGTTEQAHPER